ncbi:MAG: Gmad2 immunoglobulin-like domain-containing protein [Mycobacteriales bacterium]
MTRRLHLLITSSLAGLALVSIAGCGNGKPNQAGPEATPTTAVDASPTAAAAVSRAVAVYYVADAGPAGVRLYREFHSRGATKEVIRNAVEAMINEPPIDPDYRSLWPKSAKVLGITTQGDVATVDMGAAPDAPTQQAIQQMVWTVTAASGTITKVEIRVNGQPLTPAPVARGSSTAVLGPVWVSSPTEAGSVPRTFTMAGEATVFEATVSWEVRQGTTVVRHGFTTASVGGPGRGTWHLSISLPSAGNYQLIAYEASAKDGSRLFADTKSVIVR